MVGRLSLSVARESLAVTANCYLTGVQAGKLIFGPDGKDMPMGKVSVDHIFTESLKFQHGCLTPGRNQAINLGLTTIPINQAKSQWPVVVA